MVTEATTLVSIDQGIYYLNIKIGTGTEGEREVGRRETGRRGGREGERETDAQSGAPGFRSILLQKNKMLHVILE